MKIKEIYFGKNHSKVSSLMLQLLKSDLKSVYSLFLLFLFCKVNKKFHCPKMT